MRVRHHVGVHCFQFDVSNINFSESLCIALISSEFMRQHLQDLFFDQTERDDCILCQHTEATGLNQGIIEDASILALTKTQNALD